MVSKDDGTDFHADIVCFRSVVSVKARNPAYCEVVSFDYSATFAVARLVPYFCYSRQERECLLEALVLGTVALSMHMKGITERLGHDHLMFLVDQDPPVCVEFLDVRAVLGVALAGHLDRQYLVAKNCLDDEEAPHQRLPDQNTLQECRLCLAREQFPDSEGNPHCHKGCHED